MNRSKITTMMQVPPAARKYIQYTDRFTLPFTRVSSTVNSPFFASLSGDNSATIVASSLFSLASSFFSPSDSPFFSLSKGETSKGETSTGEIGDSSCSLIGDGSLLEHNHLIARRQELQRVGDQNHALVRQQSLDAVPENVATHVRIDSRERIVQEVAAR